jgi:ABC-type hemin transport system substrate-binding protein
MSSGRSSPLHPAAEMLLQLEPHSVLLTQRLQESAMLMNLNKAFENTSTSVAASQMRNALNNLSDTVKDPEQKKVRICQTRNKQEHITDNTLEI